MNQLPESAPAARPPGAPRRLMNRNFFLLWQGQLVSQVGNQMFMVAMMFWTMNATGSASLMGLLLTVSTLPGVLLGPLGGTFADRHSRKTIIVVCDVAAGIGVLALALLFFAQGERTGLLVGALFLLAVAGGVIQAFFRPAIAASVPDLVPREQIDAGNALNSFSLEFSAILGQSVGGLLFAWLGAPLLFLIDGLSFLFSAASESLIVIPQKLRPAGGQAGGSAGFRQDFVEGLRFVWSRRGMREFLMMVAVVNLLLMPVIVLLPFFVDLRLGQGSAWYGFLLATFSFGSLIGYAAAGAAKLRGRRRSHALIAMLVLAGAGFAALGMLTRPVPALGVFLVLGVLIGMFNIQVLTIFQTSSPSELRGRVMGLVMTMAMGVTPIGMALGGVLGDLTGKNIPLIYGSCGLLVALGAGILGMRRELLEFLAFEAPEGETP